jgi:hypothetical protein
LLKSRRALERGLGATMGILKGLGIAIIILWLVLWLAVKITVATVHLLLLVGLAMLIAGFIKVKTGPR